MSGRDAAVAKLNDEYATLLDNPESNIFNLRPTDGDIFQWHATIAPSEDSIYAGGIFELTIRVYEGYPGRAPSAWFAKPIYHPNVSSTGHVGLFQAGWDPQGNLQSFVWQIAELIDRPDTNNCHPGDDSAGRLSMGQLYEDDRGAFKEKAQEWTQMYAAGDTASVHGEEQINETNGQGTDDPARSESNAPIIKQESLEDLPREGSIENVEEATESDENAGSNRRRAMLAAFTDDGKYWRVYGSMT